MKNKTYTVVGFYRDNSQVWSMSAKAVNPLEAAKKVAVALSMDNDPHQEPGSEDLSNIEVVAVFEGDHKERLGRTYVTCADNL